METWEKIGRKVIILDYDNVRDYISEDDYKLLMHTKHHFTLPQIGDAVRVMVLHKQRRGIWLDVDTVIAGGFKELEDAAVGSGLALIDKHIGFIIADNSSILDRWHAELVKKMDHDTYTHVSLLKRVWRTAKMAKYTLCNQPEKIEVLLSYIRNDIGWDYLGNAIVNPMLADATRKEYYNLAKTIPYERLLPESAARYDTPYDRYVNFYFNEKDDVKISSPMITLHNSWTPDDYKALSRKQILADKRRLSKILQKNVIK